MGTRYNVSVVGGDQEGVESLKSEVDQRLAELNRQVSTYDPDSELSRFNESRSTEPFVVSGPTAEIVAYSLGLAKETGGAFDPTVGPLVDLWGFGPDGKRQEPPSEIDVAITFRSIGYRAIAAELSPPTLQKMKPDARVDLSAVAKGFGVDAVCELLDQSGFSAYLVEIGGEVRSKGLKPSGAAWRIGVERADSPLAAALAEGSTKRLPLQEVIELRDRAMATSGDYRNYFEHEGVRYSHTIDPRTGNPVDHDLATVTVLAETCMEADATATALLVLGPKAGYDWAVQRDVAALFVTREEDAGLSERSTPAWVLLPEADGADPESTITTGDPMP